MISVFVYNLKRFIIRIVLRTIKIKNILIVVRSNLNNYHFDYDNNVKKMTNKNIISHLKINKKLCQEIEKYCSADSYLYYILQRNQVIGYIWAHINFDPSGEIVVNEKDYFIIGPAYVTNSFRKKGCFNILIKSILYDMKLKGLNKSFAKISFDNIPSIKAFNRNTYYLDHIIFKLSNSIFTLNISNQD